MVDINSFKFNGQTVDITKILAKPIYNWSMEEEDIVTAYNKAYIKESKRWIETDCIAFYYLIDFPKYVIDFNTMMLVVYDADTDKELGVFNTVHEVERFIELIEMCNEIKSMPLKTLEDIQRAKEASRKIPMSAEKVLLFKYLIGIEEEIRIK